MPRVAAVAGSTCTLVNARLPRRRPALGSAFAGHRFGITFHRNLRSKGSFTNELEQIKGIGKETLSLLLKKFKSVKKIKERTTEELESVIGPAKTALLIKYFEGLNQ